MGFGKTGDGSTDLIVLESDNPILVQIKRRQNPNHTELIKGIREFVGTLFIEGRRKLEYTCSFYRKRQATLQSSYQWTSAKLIFQ